MVNKAPSKDIKELSSMVARIEEVGLGTQAETIFKKTGKVSEKVDIFGKIRQARNTLVKTTVGELVAKAAEYDFVIADAMIKELMVRKGLTLTSIIYIMPNGIAMPFSLGFDATGSMSKNLPIALRELPSVWGLQKWVDKDFDAQYGAAVVQDTYDQDIGKGPVVNATQFEGGKILVEQMDHLIQGRDGDRYPEDYAMLAAWLRWGTQIDIHDHYGYKGVAFLTADASGKMINRQLIKQYLGIDVPSTLNSVDSKSVFREMMTKWNFFLLQLENEPTATQWWRNHITAENIINLPSANYIGEATSLATYLLHHNAQRAEAIEWLIHNTATTNEPMSLFDATRLYEATIRGGFPVGEQAALLSDSNIPPAGSVFLNFRDAQPVWRPDTGFVGDDTPIEISTPYVAPDNTDDDSTDDDSVEWLSDF